MAPAVRGEGEIDGRLAASASAGRRHTFGRKEQIRAVALALFIEKGFDASRMDEVAAHAGVSKGTVYLYPSKQKLLRAALEPAAPLWLVPTHVQGARPVDAVDLVRQVLGRSQRLLQLSALGDVFALALSETRRLPDSFGPWLCRVTEPLQTAIAAAVRQGVDRGEFGLANESVVARILLQPMLAPQLLRSVERDCTVACADVDAACTDAHVGWVLRGLARYPADH